MNLSGFGLGALGAILDDARWFFLGRGCFGNFFRDNFRRRLFLSDEFEAIDGQAGNLQFWAAQERPSRKLGIETLPVPLEQFWRV